MSFASKAAGTRDISKKSLTVHDLHLEFAPQAQATQGGIILNFNHWNVVIHVNILRKLAVYKQSLLNKYKLGKRF